MLSELENYLQRIVDLHQQVEKILTGLPEEALNWKPVQGSGLESTNSLGILAAHIAGAEHFWIAEIIGGYPPTRNRPEEFATRVKDSSSLIDKLAEVLDDTRKIFANLTDVTLDGIKEVDHREVPVRWAILHVIDHSALHLGHMQITYQLWNGGVGQASLNWYERLPKARN